MKRLWRMHPWLVSLFLLALTLAVGFSGLALKLGSRMDDGPPPPVAAWMTPRYLVHAYHLPPEVVASALALTPGEAPRISLGDLASDRGVPVGTLIAAIESAIAAGQGPRP